MSAGSLAQPGFESQILTSDAARGRRSMDRRQGWRSIAVAENCALYTRLPPHHSDPESEFADLRRYARRRGWTVGSERSDLAGSKTDSGLNALLRDARRGRFDRLLVMRLSRIAHSANHLTEVMLELLGLGIDLVSCHDEIATTGPCHDAIHRLFSALDRMQRDLEFERQALGRDGAEKRRGRPDTPLDFDRLVELRSQGLSHRAIARLFGVSHSTVGRRLKKGK